MTEGTNRPDRIVIGVDFSPSSVAAAKWVSCWVTRCSELVLVHALVVPEMSGALASRLPMPELLLANAKNGAERRLRELGATLGAHAISIEVHEGRPADVIARVAQACNADLIVVGKHGEAGIHRGYTGRTTDHLVRASSASVLVSDGFPEGAPQRILVPVTRSSITPYIIDRTRRLFELSQAEIFLVHVVGSAVLGHVMTMSAIRSGQDLSPEEVDEVFSEDREGWKRELVNAGIPEAKVFAEVTFGEVSEGIIHAAAQHHADMIVVGSHAGPTRRLLLGSAASAVLREAGVPVLIVVEPESSLRP